MSLSFGNTSFGTNAQAQKPGGLGNFSFGSNTSTAFGSPQTNAFGATSAAPAFGATSTAPAFGATGAAPSFGQGAPSAFGAAPNPGFGTNAPAPAFGAGLAAPGFGGNAPAFGAVSSAPAFGVAPNQPNTFGGSLFGTANTSSSNTATTSQAFSFGGANTSTTGGFGGFGAPQTQPTSTVGGFGGFGAGGGSAFGGFGNSFGAPTTSAPSLFGNTSQGFGSNNLGQFGTKPSGIATGFGAQQPMQQLQQEPMNVDAAFLQSILNVSIFNDERDAIIARLNHLQALWGTGKSYFSQQNPPIEITNLNFLNRFKSMAYSKLPKKDNKMGLVALTFNKSAAQIKEQQQQVINGLNAIFGNKPTLVTHIDNVQAISEVKSQVTIYIEEKSPISNEIKRLLSTDVANYLNQPMQKNQMNNYGIEKILALLPPDEDQLKEYLQNPPVGIDPRMWQQAQTDNPDPTKFIPVPIMGNNELKTRIKCQENETEMHSLYLKKIEKDLNDLKQRHMNSAAKIIDYRRRIAKLSHSILKVIVKQETTRKIEETLLPEEELIRSKLENIQSLVIPPNEFKGRLNELVAQMKIHLNQWYDTGMLNEYSLDEESSDEMKKFLTMQQKAMSVLIETVNKDMKALQVISDGINQLAPAKH